MKTIEIVQARGLSIIIDGMQPAKSGWSFGEGHGEEPEIIVADSVGGEKGQKRKPAGSTPNSSQEESNQHRKAGKQIGEEGPQTSSPSFYSPTPSRHK